MSRDRSLLRNISEISRLPSDDLHQGILNRLSCSLIPRNQSHSSSKEAVVNSENDLQMPQRTEASMNKERPALGAMEKIAAMSRERSRSREVSSVKGPHSTKSSLSRNVSQEQEIVTT